MRRQCIEVVLLIALIPAIAGGQTVTGSGAANIVPMFTGTSSVGNSPISVSGSYVGISTTAPGTLLHIDGGNYYGGLEFSYFAKTTRLAGMGLEGTAGTVIIGSHVGDFSLFADDTAMNFSANGGRSIQMVLTDPGNVGIGTSAPGAKLEINGNVKLTSGSGASLTFADGSVQSTAYTGVTCGGDYAESVEVENNRSNYTPGDLLVLDSANPGKVLKSAEPYSTAIAGIYSTKPGTVGRRLTTPKNSEELPMALIGVVPAKVSAENGAIKVGDLLVSSSIPGYAMRGTDKTRMFGAVVGKAMGTLESGTGSIEVLVTLQ
jgi:hypothetical protein